MANSRSLAREKLRNKTSSGRKRDKEAMELFCKKVHSSSSSLTDDWDINSDPQEEIELLFADLEKRKKLSQGKKYHYDNELPRAIFRSFRVKPWMYSDISGLWIVQESGLPVLSFSFRPSPDQILLAGFFGAVCSFAGTLGQDLREIILEGTRFLLVREPDLALIFAMAIPFSMPSSAGAALLSKVREAFISQYAHYFTSVVAEIVMASEFASFNNYLTDLFIKAELSVFLQTGVLRTQNPLVFQLARSILPCTDEDLLVLSILEKSPGHVLSVQKVKKRARLQEAKVRTSLRQLEELNLAKSLRDGRSKKYASNLRGYLLDTAADPNIHQLVEMAVQEFQELIESRLSKVTSLKQLTQSI
jgi:hypothetical protein